MNVSKLMFDIEKLKEELDSLTIACNESKLRNETLVKSNVDLVGKEEELKKSIDELKEKLSKMEEELLSFNNKVDIRKKELSDIDVLLVEAQKSLEDIKKQVSAQKDVLKFDYETFEREKQSKIDAISNRLNGQIEKNQEKLDKIEGDIVNSDKILQSKINEVALADIKLEQINQIYIQKTNEIEVVDKKLERKNIDFDIMQAKYLEVSTKLANCKKI